MADTPTKADTTLPVPERQYQVPFAIDLGFTTIQGMLNTTEAGITLEWREYDLFESPKGPLSSLALQWQDIAGVACKTGFFGTKLILSCVSASSLGSFPLPAGTLNELSCAIKRKHRAQAELWAAEANLRLAER